MGVLGYDAAVVLLLRRLRVCVTRWTTIQSVIELLVRRGQGVFVAGLLLISTFEISFAILKTEMSLKKKTKNLGPHAL